MNSSIITGELRKLYQGVKKISSGEFGYKLDDKDVANKMYEEINDLLSLEVEVGRFYIDESTFDYDDSKYDVLTPKDMFALMDFLCRKDEDKAE